MGATDDYFASCADVGNQGGATDLIYSFTTRNTAQCVDISVCLAVTEKITYF